MTLIFGQSNTLHQQLKRKQAIELVYEDVSTESCRQSCADSKVLHFIPDDWVDAGADKAKPACVGMVDNLQTATIVHSEDFAASLQVHLPLCLLLLKMSQSL